MIIFKRKIEKELLKWKETPHRMPLVIKGLRQCGKTFIVRKFAGEHYRHVVYVNFVLEPQKTLAFRGSKDVDSILFSLSSMMPDAEFVPGETCLILDEIQECEEAITSLKFWALDNRYDVIASGSLLGIDYKRASSYPVGYVDHIQMYALDFEEYLWSMQVSDDMVDSLRSMFDDKKVIPEAVHTQMMNHFRTYLAIGGMPEAIEKYVSSKDFTAVDSIQKNILQGYLYDIAHYATAEEKVKAEKCYLSLTKQLLDKENHKFQYKEVEKGGRAQKYFSSVDWLVRADIAHVCRLVKSIRYELSDYARDDFFRLYTTDLSLLIAMKEFSFKQHIVENTITGNTKGGLYECAIADILYKKGYSLFFYKNDSGTKEIDFLIEKDGNPIPIEVKSNNSRATSLNGVMENNPSLKLAYKFIDGNIGIGKNGVISLPLYMAMFV